MVYPKEFNFTSEKDFTEKLVIPLLARLGYSIILNYHGSNEFGKDLVVGEFDRFFHVRYHGIQVKYIESLSLSMSEGLIADCRQAFLNSFNHPQTGESLRISCIASVGNGQIL